MSCSRTSRFALLTLVCLAAFAGGCEDDLPDPTLAQVAVKFTPPGIARGATLLIDDRVITDSLSVGRIDTLLTAGRHSFVLRPICARVEPSESLSVEIIPGQNELIEFRLVQTAAVISVRSDPSGLPVWLDGEPTALETPVDLTCLADGDYEVGIRTTGIDKLGFSYSGDTLRVVTVSGDEVEEVNFDLVREPLPQKRGVLVELFTATFCSNCPPAEEHLSELEHDEEFESEWLSTAEVHVSWGGTDVFHNSELLDRSSFYGEGGSAPSAYFNGLDETSGAQDFLESARSRILSTYDTDAKVALYLDDVRIDGSLLRGDLRFIAIEDLSGFEDPQINAFYTKDSLLAWRPFTPDSVFHAVVRDYMDDPIDLKTEGLTARGSFLDLEIVFDLAADSEWPTPSIRLCTFVQDQSTQEVLQCREVYLRLPNR